MTTDAQRDPRVEPVAGDELQLKGSGVKVLSVSNEIVCWRLMKTRKGVEAESNVHVEMWQRIMKPATIIRRGDQP